MGVLKNEIILTSKISTRNLIPDSIIYLDIKPETSLKRREGKTDLDRYDLKDLDFYNKVRSNYLELRSLLSVIWHTIDGEKSVGKMSEEINDILDKIISK